MTRDPFKITGPTCISFSGGRTSAFMLWRVLQSHGGKLPDECVVCFANTGKEDEATLRFVRDCGEQWGVPIVWLEYEDHDEPAHRFKLVDFASASRDGEPLEKVIQRKQYLPNPVTRFCTVEAKIRTMHRYLRSQGWADGDGEWDQFVGIRADEPRRVAKIRARPSPETVRETMVIPLADAGVTVQEVGAFWATQPFGLELATFNGRTLAGNCDLCFMKPPAQIQSLIKEKPERATWWIKMENKALNSKESGAIFRTDMPKYSTLLARATAQGDLFDIELDPEAEAMSCFCGD
jgi:3'-phosphoadenosine 5'-phosphosulfate sulfotransferase (PAPS reductase)/FAD synthetase